MIFALLLIFLVVFPTGVWAQPCDKICELTNKITELQGQENTLSKQITLLNSQIALTTLKITSTRNNIEKLSSEITDLNNEIDRLEELLTKRTQLVLRRIPESYKRQVTPRFGLLLFSQNFSDFISRVKYLTTVEKDDTELLFQLKATQNNFSERKKLREDKKKEQEALNKELQEENRQLAQQKRDKQALLTQTRNSESVYQMLLAQARAEQSAIKSAINQVLKLLKEGGGDPISSGETVGLIGNSGSPDCSTGAHLHFSVLKDDVAQNPANYLRNISVSWENQPDDPFSFSGDWDWPISSPSITQGFGMTYWARLGWYRGNIHDGIDMVSSSTIIKAPRAGRIIHGSTVCGVSTLKYAAIAHDNGIISVYLHVQ